MDRTTLTIGPDELAALTSAVALALACPAPGIGLELRAIEHAGTLLVLRRRLEAGRRRLATRAGSDYGRQGRGPAAA